MVLTLPALAVPAARDTVKLLYYVASDTKQQFLIPFIETTLRELVLADKKEAHLYGDVKSLNILMENPVMETEILDFQRFLNPDENIVQSSAVKKRNTQIAEELKNFQQFLKISIKRYDELLEYEFLLYNVEALSGKASDLGLEYVRGSSVFIDPRSKTYKNELIFTIRQVCVEANESPDVSVRINAARVGNSYFFAPGDTIRMEAVPIDNDSPTERFTYRWWPKENWYQDSIILNSDPSDQMQELVIPTTGEFTFCVWVCDGIDTSETTEVMIETKSPPIVMKLYAIGEHPTNMVRAAVGIFKDSIAQKKQNEGKDTSSILTLYHNAYCLFDFNEYDSTRLGIVFKANDSDTVTFQFDIQPMTPEARPLRAFARDSAERFQAGEAGADLVLELGKPAQSGKDRTAVSAEVRARKTRLRGNYALFVTARQNGLKSKQEMIPIQYLNVLPFSLSLDLNATWISKDALFKRSYFISYAGLEGRLHLLRHWDFAMKVDVSYLHGRAEFLENYRFLRNTNFSGGPCYYTSKFNSWFLIGAYEFPFNGTYNPGAEAGFSIAMNDAQYRLPPNIKFGVTCIRDNETDFYFAATVGIKFYYQPIR